MDVILWLAVTYKTCLPIILYVYLFSNNNNNNHLTRKTFEKKKKIDINFR